MEELSQEFPNSSFGPQNVSGDSVEPEQAVLILWCDCCHRLFAALRRHVLPTRGPAPQHPGLREPRLGREEPSTQPESLSSRGSLGTAGLQDPSEEGMCPPPGISRRQGERTFLSARAR